jgi:hypothetical protein
MASVEDEQPAGGSLELDAAGKRTKAVITADLKGLAAVLDLSTTLTWSMTGFGSPRQKPVDTST